MKTQSVASSLELLFSKTELDLTAAMNTAFGDIAKCSSSYCANFLYCSRAQCPATERSVYADFGSEMVTIVGKDVCGYYLARKRGE